jgi:hypothetical protein
MMMFPFNAPLLLMFVGAGNTMNNTNGLKIFIEVVVLATLSSLYTINFGIE